MQKILLVLLLSCFSSLAMASLYIAPTIEYQTINSSTADYESVLPRIALGVGGPIPYSQFYLAGELFGNVRGFTVHNSKGDTAGLKTKYSMGISVLPGWYLDEVLLAYLRIGAIETNFDNLDVSRSGFQAGIGGQTPLSPCWDARAEYTYTSYGSISGVGSPRGSEFALGLIYHFAS